MGTATLTKFRPIMFSGEMIRAILCGRKTQTRRVVKPQPIWHPEPHVRFAKPGQFYVCPDMFPTKAGPVGLVIAHCENQGTTRHMGQKAFVEDFCPYGKPGDNLWVRETWVDVYETYDGQRTTYKPNKACKHFIEYAATLKDGQCPPRWRSPLHMPRTASRITLEIADVNVERLQDICELDALAEGVEGEREIHGTLRESNGAVRTGTWIDGAARDGYAALWDRINGKSHPWSSNPWVWAITFRRVVR